MLPTSLRGGNVFIHCAVAACGEVEPSATPPKSKKKLKPKVKAGIVGYESTTPWRCVIFSVFFAFFYDFQ